jgi:hypothetical protein
MYFVEYEVSIALHDQKGSLIVRCDLLVCQYFLPWLKLIGHPIITPFSKVLVPFSW